MGTTLDTDQRANKGMPCENVAVSVEKAALENEPGPCLELEAESVLVNATLPDSRKVGTRRSTRTRRSVALESPRLFKEELRQLGVLNTLHRKTQQCDAQNSMQQPVLATADLTSLPDTNNEHFKAEEVRATDLIANEFVEEDEPRPLEEELRQTSVLEEMRGDSLQFDDAHTNILEPEFTTDGPVRLPSSESSRLADLRSHLRRKTEEMHEKEQKANELAENRELRLLEEELRQMRLLEEVESERQRLRSERRQVSMVQQGMREMMLQQVPGAVQINIGADAESSAESAITDGEASWDMDWSSVTSPMTDVKASSEEDLVRGERGARGGRRLKANASHDHIEVGTLQSDLATV
jgi:hypothetical protein